MLLYLTYEPSKYIELCLPLFFFHERSPTSQCVIYIVHYPNRTSCSTERYATCVVYGRLCRSVVLFTLDAVSLHVRNTKQRRPLENSSAQLQLDLTHTSLIAKTTHTHTQTYAYINVRTRVHGTTEHSISP